MLDEIAKQIKVEPGECSADGRFSLNATRCIGCCGLAPVLTINEQVHGKVTKDEVGKLLKPYLDGTAEAK